MPFVCCVYVRYVSVVETRPSTSTDTATTSMHASKELVHVVSQLLDTKYFFLLGPGFDAIN